MLPRARETRAGSFVIADCCPALGAPVKLCSNAGWLPPAVVSVQLTTGHVPVCSADYLGSHTGLENNVRSGGSFYSTAIEHCNALATRVNQSASWLLPRPTWRKTTPPASYLRSSVIRFKPLYKSGLLGAALRVQKSKDNYESPNTSTRSLTPRPTRSSNPQTNAAISAQFTVGLAPANHRAWASTTYPVESHIRTPPDPYFNFGEAPPSNCNTHCAARRSFPSTPTRVSGILRDTS